MTANGFVQIALYCAVVILLAKPFGGYMTRVFNGERTFLSLPLRPLERAIYALSGVKEKEEQHWKVYGLAMLAFSLAGFLSLYALQRLQAVLPFNPQHRRGLPRSGLQYFGQLRHQHQLAVLHARNHHELSGADGRADGA